MEITRETVDGVVLVRLEGRLDVGTRDAFVEVMNQVLGEGERRVVIDLAGLTYVSSSGLGACLKNAKRAQMKGAHLVWSGLTGTVLEVFEKIGFTDILEIHPDLSSAVGAANRVADGLPAVPIAGEDLRPSRREKALTYPEELLLLAVEDHAGGFVDLPPYSLEHALAGAALMDLCNRRRIDSSATELRVVDTSPVGDPILDPALEILSRSSQSHPPSHWITELAREGEVIRQRAIDRLVERGILRRSNRRLAWVLGKRRYPVVDGSEQQEVRQRVLEVIRSGAIPHPRDVVLIAIADACAVFDAILEMDQMLEQRPRIAEITRMDLLAQQMADALRTVQERDRRDDLFREQVI